VNREKKGRTKSQTNGQRMSIAGDNSIVLVKKKRGGCRKKKEKLLKGGKRSRKEGAEVGVRLQEGWIGFSEDCYDQHSVGFRFFRTI